MFVTIFLTIIPAFIKVASSKELCEEARKQSLIAISKSCKFVDECQPSSKYVSVCENELNGSIGQYCDYNDNSPGITCKESLNSKNKFQQCYRK